MPKFTFKQKKSIHLLRKTDDSISLASALLNAETNIPKQKIQFSFEIFQRISIILIRLIILIGTAYSLGNIEMVHAKLGNNNLQRPILVKL
jgi:hypothetical protein